MSHAAPRLPWLHWSIALLVVVQVGLAVFVSVAAERHVEPAERALSLHVTLGSLLTALVVARIGCRLRGSGGRSRATSAAARVVQLGLDVVLLALAVTGYVQLATLGHVPPLFGVLSAPTLPFDPVLAAASRSAHSWLAWIGATLLVLHVTAAIRAVERRT